MNPQVEFVVKVILLSTVLSFAIKYGGRYLSIPSTNLVAAIIVCSPAIAIGLILGWQYWHLPPNS